MRTVLGTERPPARIDSGKSRITITEHSPVNAEELSIAFPRGNLTVAAEWFGADFVDAIVRNRAFKDLNDSFALRGSGTCARSGADTSSDTGQTSDIGIHKVWGKSEGSTSELSSSSSELHSAVFGIYGVSTGRNSNRRREWNHLRYTLRYVWQGSSVRAAVDAKRQYIISGNGFRATPLTCSLQRPSGWLDLAVLRLFGVFARKVYRD